MIAQTKTQTETRTEIGVAGFWSAFFLRFLIGAFAGPIILVAITEGTEHEYLIRSTLAAGAAALASGTIVWLAVPDDHRHAVSVAGLFRAAVKSAVAVAKGVGLTLLVVALAALALVAVALVLLGIFLFPMLFVALFFIAGGLGVVLFLCDCGKAVSETRERRHRELVEAIRESAADKRTT